MHCTPCYGIYCIGSKGLVRRDTTGSLKKPPVHRIAEFDCDVSGDLKEPG